MILALMDVLILYGRLYLSKKTISRISKFFESSKVLQLKLFIKILLRQFQRQKVFAVVMRATHSFLGCKARTLILLGALTLRLNNILCLLVIKTINNINCYTQTKMIIGNQEIAVHLKMVRNLTGLTSGRFMIRLGLHEVTPNKKTAATPFNLLEKQPGKHENRSQFDDRYYNSRMFFMKSGMNVELNEICIFKLNSPLISETEDICQIKLISELIHIDYSKSKIVGECVMTVTERSFHSYLEMNFYDGAPCQIVGNIHSCIYKFQFYSDTNSATDIKTYAEKYSKNKIDDIVQFLTTEGTHAFEVISQHYKELTGKQPQITCIVPLKKQLSIQEEYETQKQQSKQQPKSQKLIPIGVGQKRQRKKLFANPSPPPQNQKTEGDEEHPETQLKIGERKRRKKIFHTMSKQIKMQKVVLKEQLLHENAQKVYQTWREIIGMLFKEEGSKLFSVQSLDHKKKVVQKVGESVIRFKGSQDVDMYGDQEQMRNKLAYQLRSQDRTYFKDFKSSEANLFHILDDNFFTPERPIFFEEHSSAAEGKVIEVPNQVLVILVHGLGACRLDMEKVKSEMRRYYDNKVKIYISTSNEARTEGNIDDMGVRLAAELDYQLTKYSDIPKLVLLGHSMGGLIIRSALPRLQKYKNYFHALITLSSPHLGFLYSTSALVDAGLWFINTMKKCTSIEQMTMQDNEDLKETLIYKLSTQPGLEWFNRLVFLGSHQDLYVPFYSARMQKHEESILDCRKLGNKGMVYCKMVQNLLQNFKGEIIRVNVNFCIPEQNIDNLIGRAAHISFINSVEVVRTIIIAGPHYFF